MNADEHATLARSGDGRVATVTFRGRGRVNEITETVAHELRQCMAEIRQDAGVRVVVLRSAGTTFCGGVDLTAFPTMGEQTFASSVAAEYALCQDVEALTCVTIAALAGPCIGFGFELALACDFRVAAVRAKVGFPEARVGSMAPVGRLARHVGIGTARELTLGGRVLTADEAQRLGLVTVCAPGADLDVELDRLIERYARAAPLAVRLTKQAIARAYRATAETDALEVAGAIETFRSADLREGFAAAADAREPCFEGR
jgi:enoyl-CoA hydratase/carnithine racemase